MSIFSTLFTWGKSNSELVEVSPKSAAEHIFLCLTTLKLGAAVFLILVLNLLFNVCTSKKTKPTPATPADVILYVDIRVPMPCKQEPMEDEPPEPPPQNINPHHRYDLRNRDLRRVRYCKCKHS
ncbi:uncharacterized protein DMAD_13298 [Drosophila madeirensis]|uniref:Uncharacterized protein n=1 Tax=Drosophila madeirensis TaxID=30013 RepID=A0AAU9FJQ4_DROMD